MKNIRKQWVIAVEALENRRLFNVGDIDASFNGGRNLVSTDLGAEHETVLVMDGEKIVYDTASHIDRINEDGSPDASFGTDGVAAAAGFAPVDVQLTPDGKIVIAGTLNHEFAVARYNDDGTLDTTFGDNGFALAPPATDHDLNADDLIVQSDGKIVVGGTSVDPSINVDADREDYSHDVLIRFNTDGTVDSSFGSDGVYDAGGDLTGPVSLAVLPDDSIYMAIPLLSLGQEADGSAILVSPNGTSAAGAGSNSGLLSSNFLYPTVTSDGRLYVANVGYNEAIEARYGSVPDESLAFSFGNSTLNSFTATPSNQLYAVFSSKGYGNVLARFNEDLSLDTTFAPGGFVLTSIGRTGASVYGRGALLPDGDLILPSGQEGTSNVQLTAVRVTDDPTGLDPGPSVTGLSVTAPSLSTKTLFATVTLSPNGSAINTSSVARGGLSMTIPSSVDYGEDTPVTGTLVSVTGRHATKFATFKLTLPEAFSYAENGTYNFVFEADGVRNADKLANVGGVVGSVILYAPQKKHATAVAVTTAVPSTGIVTYGPPTTITSSAQERKRVLDED